MGKVKDNFLKITQNLYKDLVTTNISFAESIVTLLLLACIIGVAIL